MNITLTFAEVLGVGIIAWVVVLIAFVSGVALGMQKRED